MRQRAAVPVQHLQGHAVRGGQVAPEMSELVVLIAAAEAEVQAAVAHLILVR